MNLVKGGGGTCLQKKELKVGEAITQQWKTKVGGGKKSTK